MSVAIIPDDELRTEFLAERARVNEDFGVSLMGAAALDAAYTAGRPWIEALTAHLAHNLDALTVGLADTSIRVVRPDASFLAWLDCRAVGLSDEELEARFRDDAGVAIEPGINFGDGGEGHVRINIGTTTSRVTDAVDRIVRAFG